jgi:hypothetical protein
MKKLFKVVLVLQRQQAEAATLRGQQHAGPAAQKMCDACK